MPFRAAMRAGVRKQYRSSLALGAVVGSYAASGGQNHDLGSYPYAQPIRPTADMTLAGLALFIDTFASPGPGSITAGISSTNPATAVTWLGNATIDTGPLGHPATMNFLFPSAVVLLGGTTYWLVAQGTLGQVALVPFASLVMTGMTTPPGAVNPGGDMKFGTGYVSTSTNWRLVFSLKAPA